MKYGKKMGGNKAVMPKEHFEKKMDCNNTGGGKYGSFDAGQEMKGSAEKLAGFAKRNRPSRG